MPTEKSETLFASWAICELMGHRRLGGYVSETTIAGAAFLRVDVPAADGEGFELTQFYGAASVYCLTPCSEDAARAVAAHNRPRPVSSYELPALPRREPDGPPLFRPHDDDDDDDESSLSW